MQNRPNPVPSPAIATAVASVHEALARLEQQIRSLPPGDADAPAGSAARRLANLARRVGVRAQKLIHYPGRFVVRVRISQATLDALEDDLRRLGPSGKPLLDAYDRLRALNQAIDLASAQIQAAEREMAPGAAGPTADDRRD